MATKRKMADALTASLNNEQDAVQKRFELAESVLEKKAPKIQTPKASSKVAVIASPKPKPLQEKVIRDTFSLPQTDYTLIDALRKRCLKAETSATKSEIIRAGLHALSAMNNQELTQTLKSLQKVKAGRPKVKTV